MTARARVWIVVGLAAVAAVGTVVGVTLATRTDVQRQSSKPPPFAAEPEFRAAVQAAPNDPEALTAAAVGLYDKDRPAAAFSRLGPLARRFPQAQTVRFHLGLLLIYFGDMPRARRELALARAQGPRTLLGNKAETLLKAGRNP